MSQASTLEKHHIATDRVPRLTSLGLAVIDTIKFGDGTVVHDVLGGSGVYSSIGALLFSNDAPQLVAFKVLAGTDFPDAVELEMRKWNIDLTIQKDAQCRSVRGLLEYEDTTFGSKKFRYTTPVLHVRPRDISSTPAISASAFHCLCAPDKVEDLVSELLICRGTRERPLIVWEPAPPSCTAKNLEVCSQAVRFIHVFSPNHLELLRFCNRDQEPFSRSLIEECATMFLAAGIGPQMTGSVVIRAGEHGCMIMTTIGQPATWLPPYYTSKDREKIVDPTGAGNGFLGGFIRGYQETGSAVEAAYYGTVAASYMLEQLGTPSLTRSDDGTAYWNGENPVIRLEALKARCGLRENTLFDDSSLECQQGSGLSFSISSSFNILHGLTMVQ